LRDAGWAIQDIKKLDRFAKKGVAAREFPIAGGKIDYVLYVDGSIVGTIEAKKFGEVLANVEPQSKRYCEGIVPIAREKGYPHDPVIPFHFISTGMKTVFVDLRDPKPRPRQVFAFYKPETLAAWLLQRSSLRQRLQTLPRLDPEGLRKVQVEAI